MPADENYEEKVRAAREAMRNDPVIQAAIRAALADAPPVNAQTLELLRATNFPFASRRSERGAA